VTAGRDRAGEAGPGPAGPLAGAAADGSGPAALIARLVERGETLAVAESLTGGLLAATIVNVAGASAVFRGGLVVYATDLKASLAGVDEDLLRERGPVDPDVAGALAEGARRRCAADWGLATTGVAGPTSQDGHPVGTVYVAVAGPGGAPAHAFVRRLALSGTRPQIRAGAVAAALDLLDGVIGHATAEAPRVDG
jgi:nicotinamide-nucleotide amidase